jgi:integrase
MATDLVTRDTIALEIAGQLANGYAAQGAFADYQSRKAENTLRRQRADLDLFVSFLETAGIPGAPTGDALFGTPDAWRGVTWGLVEAWRNWMLQQGYAIGSTNVRLSTVKSYAKLAAKAGVLQPAELAMVRAVDGYSHKEARRIDDRRAVSRVGGKKATAVAITPAQAKRLKKQPNTPQGRRDAVLLCLLLDHGLRVSEVAGLEVSGVDLAAGTITFYRQKVAMTQTHKLSRDAKHALKAYIEAGDAPAVGPLLRASAGAQRLTHAGVSERNLSERVLYLGAEIGIEGLSAHDCRHYWATQAARYGTPIDALMQGGGWNSHAMPLRYIQAAEIANHGVRLEEE